jgi:uncharacterized protein (TIGR02246 family)
MIRVIKLISMAMLVSSLCVTGAGASPSGAQQDAAELVSFKSAIRKLYDIKEGAWKKGDFESIVTRFYAADAVSAGEGDPSTMKGVDQFRKAYQQMVQDITSVRIESVRSVVNGNAGWDWANFYATVKLQKAQDYPQSPVRVLFLFSKEHGRWICKGDIFVNGKFSNPL